ncbi:hypothetical protein [Deinococcus humi]|uniref:Uncharacterized protein n=1 Tax=Deinococcus humi TaxID=662880 RepID=A0A7W8NGQ2_9DEIO|nr:hypothetical protein [Deinococcus humi]MBB5365761.1 hypothetical protein [Deinococcus humi]GGO38311.1 hypothetical protein GCM10008949_44620 [Deinococcus humi]
MVNIRVENRKTGTSGIYFFSQVPRIGESVRIGTTAYRVKDVQHVAGDPTDNIPPAFTQILVEAG